MRPKWKKTKKRNNLIDDVKFGEKEGDSKKRESPFVLLKSDLQGGRNL